MIAVLKSNATRNGKDFVCRKLKIMGTEASVPVLAEMLGDDSHSHMARYALESMGNPAAGAALRAALPKVSGKLRIGMVSSLGVRQENESVPALADLLADDDADAARSAAHALGAIRTPEAAKALLNAKPNEAAAQAVTDAMLACAESLLANGNKIAALGLYKRVSQGNPPKHVKLAATRGMLAGAAN